MRFTSSSSYFWLYSHPTPSIPYSGWLNWGMAAWLNALLGLYTGFPGPQPRLPPWPGTPSAYTLQVSMVVVFVRDSAIAFMLVCLLGIHHRRGRG